MSSYLTARQAAGQLAVEQIGTAQRHCAATIFEEEIKPGALISLLRAARTAQTPAARTAQVKKSHEIGKGRPVGGANSQLIRAESAARGACATNQLAPNLPPSSLARLCRLESGF